MAMRSDHLRPRGGVTRSDLERYVQGVLPEHERNRIEQHLEQDPLLREALEGLSMPGALEALRTMQRPAPQGGVKWGAWGALAVIVAGLAVALLVVKEEPVRAPQAIVVTPAPDVPYKADSAMAVVEHEITQAVPVPAPQQIGHAHATVPPPAPRDTSTLAPSPSAPIDTIAVAPAVGPRTDTTLRPPALHRGGRKLAYVHDLVIVDPTELYPRNPLITEPGGVPASYADEADRRARQEAPRTMRYTDYMEVALGRFVRNDHKGCLQDLLFLLAQYPKDVNARFYAGLCCYNLGLPERAKGYLQAVANDPVETFHEEAAWYLALSVDRADGRAAATAHFRHIAEGGGFYAAEARERLDR